MCATMTGASLFPQFSGTWHSVAILRQSGGWDHVTARAIAVSDGDIVLHYTGTKYA